MKPFNRERFLFWMLGRNLCLASVDLYLCGDLLLSG